MTLWLFFFLTTVTKWAHLQSKHSTRHFLHSIHPILELKRMRVEPCFMPSVTNTQTEHFIRPVVELWCVSEACPLGCLYRASPSVSASYWEAKAFIPPPSTIKTCTPARWLTPSLSTALSIPCCWCITLPSQSIWSGAVSFSDCSQKISKWIVQ